MPKMPHREPQARVRCPGTFPLSRSEIASVTRYRADFLGSLGQLGR